MRILGKCENSKGQTRTDRIVGMPKGKYRYVLTSIIQERKYGHNYYAIELRHLKEDITEEEIREVQENYSPKKVREIVKDSLTEEDLELLQNIVGVKINNNSKDTKNILSINKLSNGRIIARSINIMGKDVENFIYYLDKKIIDAKICVENKAKRQGKTIDIM